MLVGCRITQLKRKAAGEKGPSTEPKPVTYTQPRSFNHASYGISQAPWSPVAPYVLVMGVLLTV